MDRNFVLDLRLPGKSDKGSVVISCNERIKVIEHHLKRFNTMNALKHLEQATALCWLRSEYDGFHITDIGEENIYLSDQFGNDFYFKPDHETYDSICDAVKFGDAPNSIEV